MNATRDGLTENEALRLVEAWSAEGVARGVEIEHRHGTWTARAWIGRGQALAASSPNLTWALYDLFLQVEAAGGAWGRPAPRQGPAP